MSESHDEQEMDLLVNRVVDGDIAALAELFAHYRNRLWRVISFRLDPRLHGRVDPDDVLQETWLNAAQRIEHFLKDASRSIFIWFRIIACQTLVDVHRRHIGAKKRNASREFSIDHGWNSQNTSASMAFHLLGHMTSPSQAAVRAELSQQLDTALGAMRDIDREVLTLRHFEELTNRETAQVLDISEQAASDRYIRALAHLKSTLRAIPGFIEP